MKTLLMVTWIISGQQPSSYQTPFATMEACLAARASVTVEADRLNTEAQQKADKYTNLVGALSSKWIGSGALAPDAAINAAQQLYKMYYTPPIQSKVSAICVAQ